MNDSAHYMRVGAPMRFPIVIAQHCSGGCAGLRILRIEKPPPGRNNSEAAEIIAGYQVRPKSRLAFDHHSQAGIFRNKPRERTAFHSIEFDGGRWKGATR